LQLGARGGILAVALFAPELSLEIWDAHKLGHPEDAANAQKPLAPMAAEIVARMGVPGVKAAMEKVGLAGGHVRLPLLPTPSADLAIIDTLLSEPALSKR
jgi:dihydrodipicolinate synthase/N-acetylneuraminate lyase